MAPTDRKAADRSLVQQVLPPARVSGELRAIQPDLKAHGCLEVGFRV